VDGVPRPPTEASGGIAVIKQRGDRAVNSYPVSVGRKFLSGASDSEVLGGTGRKVAGRYTAAASPSGENLDGWPPGSRRAGGSQPMADPEPAGQPDAGVGPADRGPVEVRAEPAGLTVAVAGVPGARYTPT